MKTWTMQTNNRLIEVKALKADYEHLRNRLNSLLRVKNSCIELLGVKPENETPEQYADAVKNSCVMYMPFGTSPAPQEAINFMDALPNVIDADACKRIAGEAHKLYLSLLPVVDKRETKAERQAWQAEHAANEAEREEKHLREFVDIYCASREFIEIPAGQMAVTLSVTFDDSHMMSDYHHPHALIGERMLLAIVPKQSERQDLARRVLAAYPELTRLEWTWHTENWSMGHGNYLMSEWLPEIEHRAYDGRTKVAVRWEISFSSYEKKLRPFSGYPGEKSQQAEVAPANGNGQVSVRLNAEKNGVEILFAEKPESGVLGSLKSHGFRWSPAGKLWYAKQSPEKIAFANSLAA